jgi:hypothetical protein
MKEERDRTGACIYTLQGSGLRDNVLSVTGARVRS